MTETALLVSLRRLFLHFSEVLCALSVGLFFQGLITLLRIKLFSQLYNYALVVYRVLTDLL